MQEEARDCSGSLVILSAGRLEENKGHHRVIAALQAIRGNGTDAELLVAGGTASAGRYAEVLRNQVSGQDSRGTYASSVKSGRNSLRNSCRPPMCSALPVPARAARMS